MLTSIPGQEFIGMDRLMTTFKNILKVLTSHDFNNKKHLISNEFNDNSIKLLHNDGERPLRDRPPQDQALQNNMLGVGGSKLATIDDLCLVL